MGDVRVRNLDDNVVLELKDRAKRNGRSLEGELREILTEEARRPRVEWAERLEQLRESIRARCGTLPDSTPIIREERDRWG